MLLTVSCGAKQLFSEPPLLALLPARAGLKRAKPRHWWQAASGASAKVRLPAGKPAPDAGSFSRHQRLCFTRVSFPERPDAAAARLPDRSTVHFRGNDRRSNKP